MITPGVSFQGRSSNRKLSPTREVHVPNSPWPRFEPIGPYICTTYVSIAETCPSSCAFKDAGCFAQTGMTGRLIKKLDQAATLERERYRLLVKARSLVEARDMLGEEGIIYRSVAHAEAAAIDRQFQRGVPQDGAKGGRDLRLHVSGDVRDAEGAKELAGAASRWYLRDGGDVYTYTHRAHQIPREDWGGVDGVSILSSVETPKQARLARDRGYAIAIVVRSFPDDTTRAFELPGVPGKIIPCPAETGVKKTDGSEVTCVDCRLCFDADALYDRNRAIGFAAHGAVKKAKRKLPVFSHDEPLLARLS